MQVLKGYLPANDGLKNALTGADVVVIPAGIPRKSFRIELW
jgi:malate dehydrogenase